MDVLIFIFFIVCYIFIGAHGLFLVIVAMFCNEDNEFDNLRLYIATIFWPLVLPFWASFKTAIWLKDNIAYEYRRYLINQARKETDHD